MIPRKLTFVMNKSPLYCLSLFNLWLLIESLVSSNISFSLVNFSRDKLVLLIKWNLTSTFFHISIFVSRISSPIRFIDYLMQTPLTMIITRRRTSPFITVRYCWTNWKLKYFVNITGVHNMQIISTQISYIIWEIYFC
jgi:hypothetical protein